MIMIMIMIEMNGMEWNEMIILMRIIIILVVV